MSRQLQIDAAQAQLKAALANFALLHLHGTPKGEFLHCTVLVVGDEYEYDYLLTVDGHPMEGGSL